MSNKRYTFPAPVFTSRVLRARLLCEQSGLLTHIADNGKRFVVRADEKLTDFVELESATQRPKAEYGSRKSVGPRLTD